MSSWTVWTVWTVCRDSVYVLRVNTISVQLLRYTSILGFEEWRLLGCYAVWVL
jgi:hypothetical protein